MFAEVLDSGAEQHEEGQFRLAADLTDAVGPFIACVQEMSQLDPNSDFLRFPVNKHFRQAARPLDGLDLVNLKLTVSKLANFLTITRRALESQIDLRDEYAEFNPYRSLGPEELQRMTVSELDELFGADSEN
jgi:hypothetical protein